MAAKHKHCRKNLCKRYDSGKICSAYHPHVGKNHCSCYWSLLSGRYKRETPSVPGLSMLLMGQQMYHPFSPSKDSARGPHTKSVKVWEIFAHFPFCLKRVSVFVWSQMWPWMFHCVSPPQQAAAWWPDIQLTYMWKNGRHKVSLDMKITNAHKTVKSRENTRNYTEALVFASVSG